MFVIAIHGGAGTISPASMTEEKYKAYTAALEQALDAGYRALEANGTALDAVCAAVVSLEDCPLFNAGRGAVFNHEGQHEMDAAVMRGDTLEAGAVCGVKHARNPVLLSRMVMEHSEHVLLSGDGAEAFGKAQGAAFETGEYFYDAFRYEQYKDALKEDRVQLDHSEKKFGTVGAVALDIHGNIAAATSTGGMTNKRYGRIGDSPLIGAGTYANNKTCAVSCTGHGELFIRTVVAHEVSSLMRYGGKTLEEATDEVVKKQLVEIGGEGGLIAVDTEGNVSLSFNSEGMYRGYRKSNGESRVAIYK
ncbi:isoaspartyl peptidase/L-asparaginase family protein [Chitinophagaceae bacterium MMS25-I14]